MAVLLLDEVPDDLEVERDADGFVCTIPVCECSQEGQVMTLDCRLDPMPDHGPDIFEFSYGFTISDIENVAPAYFTQDRDEVRRYLDALSPEHILPTVQSALCSLVEHVQPSYIFRVTKGRNLPQKALRKHTMVTDTLYGLGYGDADSGTDGTGRTFRLMAR